MPLLGQLNAHAKVLHGSNTFTCSYPACDASFGTNAKRTKQACVVHTKVGSTNCVLCPVECPSTFSSPSKLERHVLRVHDGLHLYACMDYDMWFS